jgi:hypothetical protein
VVGNSQSCNEQAGNKDGSNDLAHRRSLSAVQLGNASIRGMWQPILLRCPSEPN